MKLRRWLKVVASVGPSLLRLLGVKKGTVAADAVNVAKAADEVLPPEK